MKAPPKLVCLESYWNEKLFQTFSVKGFLDAMAPLAHPPHNRAGPLLQLADTDRLHLRLPTAVWAQLQEHYSGATRGTP